MTCSLRDLRAFAVRNRLDVTFHVRTSNAAWMVDRRGLVAQPAVGDVSVAGVEQTLEAADEFLVEGDKQARRNLTRGQFFELLATRAATSAGREKEDE